MDERMERVYARWCARSVMHLWDAPEVVRRWVDAGEEGLRDAARAAAVAVATSRDAARDATRDAGLAAWAAARDAAMDAELYAARAVKSRAEALRAEALRAEARRARSGVTAWFAEGVKQSRIRDLLDILPDLLRAHGLAARLLDDVREDPWLTREVVRVLGSPDLAAWCDWCKQMEDDR